MLTALMVLRMVVTQPDSRTHHSSVLLTSSIKPSLIHRPLTANVLNQLTNNFGLLERTVLQSVMLDFGRKPGKSEGQLNYWFCDY